MQIFMADEPIVKTEEATPAPSSPIEPESKSQQSIVEEPTKPEVEKSQDPDDADDYDTATKSLIPQENYRQSPLFYELANYFGVEEREYGNAVDKLSLICDWAINETKSNKLEDILTKVRSVERRLTTPTWGERRYAKVYGYLRLATKMQAFKTALSAYEEGVEG